MSIETLRRGLWLLILLACHAFATTPASASDLGDRIAQTARELATQRVPYVTQSLGGPEGPEQAGLPETGLDCMTFVEAVLMRAAGTSDQRKWLGTTRYDEREPGYCTRAHYTSDWIDRNHARGWLTDVTPELAMAGSASLRTHAWKRSWMATHDLDPTHCVEAQAGGESVSYIAPDDYPKIASSLLPGDLLVFVARLRGLDTAHVGIVEPRGALAMASSAEGHTLIKPDWQAYAKAQSSRYLGVRVIRITNLP